MPNPPPQLCFRPFAEADATVLEPWLRGAGLLVPSGTKSGSWARRITEDPRILVRVAHFAGRPTEPVGFFRLDLAPDRAAELTMIVSPEYRRQGLGRALLSDALAEARSLSLRRILASAFRSTKSGTVRSPTVRSTSNLSQSRAGRWSTPSRCGRSTPSPRHRRPRWSMRTKSRRRTHPSVPPTEIRELRITRSSI